MEKKTDKLILRLHFTQNGDEEFTFHLPKLSIDKQIEVSKGQVTTDLKCNLQSIVDRYYRTCKRLIQEQMINTLGQMKVTNMESGIIRHLSRDNFKACNDRVIVKGLSKKVTQLKRLKGYVNKSGVVRKWSPRFNTVAFDLLFSLYTDDPVKLAIEEEQRALQKLEKHEYIVVNLIPTDTNQNEYVMADLTDKSRDHIELQRVKLLTRARKEMSLNDIQESDVVRIMKIFQAFGERQDIQNVARVLQLDLKPARYDQCVQFFAKYEPSIMTVEIIINFIARRIQEGKNGDAVRRAKKYVKEAYEHNATCKDHIVNTIVQMQKVASEEIHKERLFSWLNEIESINLEEYAF